jgi:hypothetical protein
MTDLDPSTPEAPTSPYEPAIDAAPATLVEAPATAVRRRSARWPIAIGLVALVAAVSVAVALLITGQAPNAKVLAYVPDGTVMYGEARLDLPGDQRLALASFLSKFPGFADQSAIEPKFNEVMDRLIEGLTNGDQTYSHDIQPWFDGELAFSVGPLPDPGALSGGGASALKSARFLVLVSIKDPAAVTTWFKALAAKSGATTADQTYDNAPMTVLTADGGLQGAFAVIDGKVAVVGDVDSVKAAIDTNGKGPFAAQTGPKAALDATDSSHLGFVYVALKPLLDWSSQVSQSSGAGGSLGADLSSGALGGIVPDWGAFALRVENDAVVLESATATPATPIGPVESRTSTVTDHVPAGALLVTVSHDYGATLVSTLNAYRSDPALKPTIDAIDQGAGLLGGTAGAMGWIGDTAIVVSQADAAIEGGLVIVPTDRSAAERTFTSLRTVISLGGAQAGISVTDEPYAGTTITTVDLGDIATLAAKAGIPADVAGAGSALPAGHLQVAYAITDSVVVVGGPAFVKHVLDTTAATSIASTDRFKTLAGRVGTGTSIAFVDIAAIRGLIESALATADPSSVAQYDQNVKPYLVPFDALIASGSVQGGVSSSRTIITVK